jgi:hypothetical protein
MKPLYRKQLTALPHTRDNIGGWQGRHIGAVACPRTEYERALVELLSGWLRYADAAQERWESGIGNDYVLGPNWAQIGTGIRGLLNGDLGRLDGGTLDHVLCRTLEAEGLDPATL